MSAPSNLISRKRLFLLLLVLCLCSPYMFAQADVKGQWTTLPEPMPLNPVHVALLNNGKVLVVSGSGNLETNPNLQGGVWDPQTGITSTQQVPFDMFCSGMTALADGRILINGGNLQYAPFLGLPNSAIYDPFSDTYTEVQPTKHGRWYPTLTLLGDGRIMTFSGLNETNGNTNNAVEIYSVGSGWSQEFVAPWTPPLYPRMHLLPNGLVLYSGPSPATSLFDPSAHTWTGLSGTNYGERLYGSSVLLPLLPSASYRPKVFILGGGTPSTSSTEIDDLGAPVPSWQWGPNMSQPRIEMDAVILPSGKVLALGGSAVDEDGSTASLNADLYNPATNTFSSAGANAFPRLYHTVALLLPDATVWLAGGNPNNNTYEHHIEIYRPAYLFTRDASGNIIPAQRPTITSAPSITSWGAAFTVQTPNASDIASAVLVRPGSSTHSFDMDQRLIGLSFTRGSGTLTLNSPPNQNIAPPGYYMLFLVNSSGVPSIANFIQIGSATDFSTAASPRSQSTLQGSSTSYTVSVAPFAGSLGTVNLSVNGLPLGAAGTFSPLTISDSGSATLTIDTQGGTPLGSYLISVTATSGSLSHTANAWLNIKTIASPPFGIDTIAPNASSVPSYVAATPPFSTNQPNELLLAFISAESPEAPGMMASTVTGGGLTWHLVKRANAQPGDAEIWRAYSLAPLNSVVVTAGLDQSMAALITVVTFTGTDSSGTDGSGAIGASGNFSAGTGAPTGSLVTTRNNSWVFGVGNDWSRAVARTLGPNQTMVQQFLSTTGSTFWIQRQNTVTPLAGTSVTINDTAPTNDKFNLSMVEVLPAAATGPDFSLSAGPSSQTVQPGGSAGYTTTVTAQNGFSGTTSFVVNGLPTGTSGSFNPISITGSGSSILTISTSTSTPLGSYPLSITGSSGSLVHAANITLVVSGPPDFTVSAIPASQTVQVGSATTYNATITAQNGFTGTTSFAMTGLPAGATSSFNPTSVTGSGSSTLTITTSTSTPVGSYPLTVTASGGSLSHGVGITLVVTAGPPPTAQLVIDKIAFGDRTSASPNVTTSAFSTTQGNELLLAFVSLDTPPNGGVTVSGVSGGGVTWNLVRRTNTQAGDAEVWRAFASSTLSNATITATLSQNNACSMTVVTFAGADATGINGTGAIGANLSFSARSGAPIGSLITTRNNSWVFGVGTDWDRAVARTLGPNQTLVHSFLSGVGSTYWVQRQNNPTPLSGTTVTINDTAPTNDRYDLTVVEVLPAIATGPDFSLAATPASQTVPAGSDTSYTATVIAQNGFSGGIDLTATGLPLGTTGNFNPPSVSGSGTSALTVSTATSTAPGSYPFTITGTSGSLIHTANATLVISGPPDFTFSASPASRSVPAGSATTYTATVTAQNGFAGTTSFAITGLPADTTASFNPATVTGSGSSVLTISTAATTALTSYPLIITAMSGSLSHTANVSVLVTGPPDFILSAAPASQTTPAGSGISYTATITAQNGFSGVTSFSVTGLPTGTTATFTPATVTGSGSSTMNLTTSSSTAVADYPLTITATSGTLSHTAGVSLSVAVAPPPSAGLAVDKIVFGDRTSGNLTVTTSAFSTTQANELLLAFVSLDTPSTGGTTVSSVTGAGVNWAFVRRTNTQAGDAEIWRAFASSAVSNATVTATLSETVASSITVVTFTGADTTGTNGSGAVGATGSFSSLSGAPAGSLVTTRNQSWVFGVGTDWDRAVARTIGPNQTMLHQFLPSVGSTYWVQRQNAPTLLSGTAVTINDTAPSSDRYDLTLIEVLPAP